MSGPGSAGAPEQAEYVHPRGRLRVYLGAAPGVGKTVAMLSEGRRRATRGTDVLIGVVETHGREFTAGQLADLPVATRRLSQHRGVELAEMDVEAILTRHPEVVLVDELAHTNSPGSVHEKRWQDVDQLLAAGIDVVTTVNIQHLESLNDVVAAITGMQPAETVPDEVVRSAEQIELVDMTPQALRRRMAHGHIYPAERIDTALGNFFREGNLTALRELALLWVADRVEEGLDRYRAAHGIKGTWAARDRVVVALTGGPESPLLLRRGARIAGRVAGRSLVAVHVVRSDGSAESFAADLEKYRLLVENLGGTLQLVIGDDIAATVLEFARAVNGTQIVVGASRHGRLTQLLRPSTSNAIVRGSGDIDVYVVTHQRVPRSASWSPRVRRGNGWPWAGAVVIPIALAAGLLPLRHDLALSTVLLVFLLGVLANSLIGGVLPAVLAALIAGLLTNFLFTPPYGSLTISQPENAFALVVFLVVGITVASVVDRSAGRAQQAARGRAEAQLIAAVATGVVDAADPVRAVLDQARTGFGMRSVALLSTAPAGVGRSAARRVVVGTDPPLTPAGEIDPAAAEVTVPAGADWVLALYGHPLTPADRKLAGVFAAQAVLAVERARLTASAEQGERLRQADRVRTAVLAALSHDLRTPLATIKASVSSLRDRSIAWTEEDQVELLAAADQAADHLDDLLANLLDLSRLQTGVLVPVRRAVSVDEVVHRALIGIPMERIHDAVPDDLPLVDTDAGLLERVVANIVANAVQHSPDGAEVRVLAGEISDDQGRRVQIRIVDDGPGVREADREAMFAPFQRLGDVPAGSGVGLGLAVARGLAEAVDATIDAEDTAGGGLTMIITVPLSVPGATEPLSPGPGG